MNALSRHSAIVLSLAIAAATTAWTGAVAASDEQKASPQLDKIADSAQILAETRERVAAAKSGEYGRMSTLEMRRMESAERRITKLLQGRPDISSLDAEEKIDVYNARQTIAGIVSDKDGTHRVCKRVQRVGTRLKTSRCMTAAEADALAQSAQEAARDMQRTFRVPPTEGSSRPVNVAP